jgi:hypothetical protein
MIRRRSGIEELLLLCQEKEKEVLTINDNTIEG